MLPKVLYSIAALSRLIPNQGSKHHQRLCGHQDNPWLLLPALLSRDDHREHVSHLLYARSNSSCNVWGRWWRQLWPTVESVRSPRRGFSTVSPSKTCSASCTAVVGSLSVICAYFLLLHGWYSNISLFLLRNEQLQWSVCLQSWPSRKIRRQWDHLGNTWFNQSPSQSLIFAI